jgi:hypothetical protein
MIQGYIIAIFPDSYKEKQPKLIKACPANLQLFQESAALWLMLDWNNLNKIQKIFPGN